MLVDRDRIKMYLCRWHFSRWSWLRKGASVWSWRHLYQLLLHTIRWWSIDGLLLLRLMLLLLGVSVLSLDSSMWDHRRIYHHSLRPHPGVRLIIARISLYDLITIMLQVPRPWLRDGLSLDHNLLLLLLGNHHRYWSVWLGYHVWTVLNQRLIDWSRQDQNVPVSLAF